MSELNDDLLNYELGDDIDDQALYGADEDELLLSDDELEKDVTKEEKQQLKAEAEQWVQLKIQSQDGTESKEPKANGVQQATTSEHPQTEIKVGTTPTVAETVAGSALQTEAAEVPTAVTFLATQHAVSTSEVPPSHFKQPVSNTQKEGSPVSMTAPVALNNSTNVIDVSSSCGKEQEVDHTSVNSGSTGVAPDHASQIHSSQESIAIGGGPTGGGSDFSDTCEDYDEEVREGRMNPKTTNERDVETTSSDQSPEKSHARSMYNKRGGGNPLLRTHGMRGGPYHMQRPLLRLPTHGQFPPQPALNPYVSHNPHAPGPPGTGGPPTLNPNTHPHDPMSPNQPQQRPPRQLYPGGGFRGGGPMTFRHHNPAGMYAQRPQGYGNGSGPPFNQNFGHPRAMYRPEMQVAGPMMPCGPTMNAATMRGGMRLQRPPLQALAPHNMAPHYVNGPLQIRPQQQPQQLPQQQQQPPSVPLLAAGTVSSIGPPGQPQLTLGLPPNAVQRPNKVLINPNFKGGVEAAKNKFIKETQFMSVISSHVSHLQSDDELLRQQEEFINKNRQHIEKRRQERAATPPNSRRSRSRTRSQSHERSYSPAAKRGAGGVGERHFERDRERSGTAGERERFGAERERERERDRSERVAPVRANSRDRDRSARGGAASGRGGGNRFRRGSSRERDYENRSGMYGKRRRSVSPTANRGGGNGGRRAGAERDRNDAEEDEETRRYRLEIEKQKALREQVMRDKELKRRKAAEDKQYEEKRGTVLPNNSSGAGNNNNVTSNSNAKEELDAKTAQLAATSPQKLRPLIVTEPKMISLKKRQQQRRETDESQPVTSQLRKQIPTAKILPEAKRTLADHLTHAHAASGLSGGVHHHMHSNTAIIKPVQKKDTNTPTPPPPKQSRRLYPPSDDEVELDYDEDELMLEDEERLLATPTPSPKRVVVSRTPTPEPPPLSSSQRNSSSSSKGTSKSSTAQKNAFASSNRRVILRNSSTSSSTTVALSESTSKTSSRRGSNRQHEDHGGGNGTGSSSSRKGIFDRLDSRRLQQLQQASTDRRKGQRVMLKHHD